MSAFTLQELAKELGEPFEGDGSIQLKGVAEITSAKEGELSFVANPKYVAQIPNSNASALIVPKDLDTEFRPLIRSENPYLSFTKALHLFHQERRPTSGGVHPTSQISPSAKLGADATIMAHAIVEDDVMIGDRVVLYPGVFIGRGAKIGADATLYPHVSVNEGCEIQSRVILHAGCRIGASIIGSDMAHPPVVIGSDVELGANVVASGMPGAPTKIGEGAKIDNLVQIGVGVTIGHHCIIVAQVCLGDGVTLGEHATIAGQVVISKDIQVGPRSRIGAQSVVTEDVPADADYWGAPAQPHSQEKRQKANLARLPKLFEKLRQFEDKISGTS